MASQNLGQVAGLWIGTSAPANTSLIWFDSTPAIRCHKVYSPTAAAWVVLEKSTISAVTRGELKRMALEAGGLTQGSWYKITDLGNTLALAITPTKIQYVDLTSDAVVIDDFISPQVYTISSENLLIDDINGVWEETEQKLKFSFDETAHDGNGNDDYLFGKKKRDSIWSLAKYKLSALVSAVTGNALSWNKGVFFNFNKALSEKTDVSGGVVGKAAYDADKVAMQKSIDNVSAANQAILSSANGYTYAQTTNEKVYAKTLPTAPTPGTAIDIAQGDALTTIVNKIQRWITQFKTATGIKVSPNFSPATSMSAINNNDTVDSALRKIQYWYNHIELSLSSTWSPKDYKGTIADVAAGDTFPDAFAKLQGKFNQLGIVSRGKVESRPLYTATVAQTVFDLDNGSLILKDASGVNRTSMNGSGGIEVYNSNTYKTTTVQSKGVSANGCGETVYPASLGVSHAASVVGLGYGNKTKGLVYNTDDTRVQPFIAGVAGTAINSATSDPCNSYGGWFAKAKIYGLYLKCRRVSASSVLSEDDDFITCYNGSDITITLPSAPYCGKILKIVQVNAAKVTVAASSDIIHSSQNNGTSQSSVVIGGLGRIAELIYDGQLWHMAVQSM